MSVQQQPVADTTRPAHASAVALLRLGVGLALATLIAWLGWLSVHVERPRESPVQTISVLDQPRPEPLEPTPEPEPPEAYDAPPAASDFVELTAPPLDSGNAPDDALGVDADGSGGGDGFGLRAKRGGRALIGADTGSGDDRAAAWRGFAALVVQRLERLLNGSDAVRSADYDVRVRLWIEIDGQVLRAEIARSSGAAAIDAAIVEVLEQRAGAFGAPPADMPQPVNIRVRSRRAG